MLFALFLATPLQADVRMGECFCCLRKTVYSIFRDIITMFFLSDRTASQRCKKGEDMSSSQILFSKFENISRCFQNTCTHYSYLPPTNLNFGHILAK